MQAGLADRFHQRHDPGLRDRPTTAALDAGTQVALDALPHLGSASSGWRRDRIGSALRGENLGTDRHGFFGCPFVSAAVEAELDSKAHAATVAHTRRRQEWLTGLAGAAGAAQPAALAAHLGLLIDGALASGRLLQDRAVVDAAKASARAAVLAHTAPTTTAA
ncbi:TetR/AcrR family transcriptional regulator [Streptomyces griseoincarnatus]